MSANNLEIWDKVFKTDPSAVKPITEIRRLATDEGCLVHFNASIPAVMASCGCLAEAVDDERITWEYFFCGRTRAIIVIRVLVLTGVS